MALKNILPDVASNLGLDETVDRSRLLTIINEAAKMLYEIEDLPGSLNEVVLAVSLDNQLSLPDFIGPLRSMREYLTQEKIELVTMRPRYSYKPWANRWRQWRLKGNSPLMLEATNTGVLFLQCKHIENVDIIVSGKTADSNRIEETITMDTYTKQTVNSYTEIYSIEGTGKRDYDINIFNLQFVLLATLRNDQNRTDYQIVDVKEYPFTTVATLKYIEVLYKKPYRKFVNDGDEFPVADIYDDAIKYAAIATKLYQDPKKTDLANAYASRSLGHLTAAAANITEPTEKEMTFSPNPLLELRRRYNSGLFNTRYRMYLG